MSNKIKIKSATELVKEGLVSELEVAQLPYYFSDTVAFIFNTKQEAIKYCTNVLVPKVGVDVLATIWSCLTGPPSVAEEGIAKMLGLNPDHCEKWLLFKKEDFEKYIRPAIE